MSALPPKADIATPRYAVKTFLAAGQTGTASTTLTADSVGTTRLSRNPVLSSKARYSGSVRSCPPGTASMISNLLIPAGLIELSARGVTAQSATHVR